MDTDSGAGAGWLEVEQATVKRTAPLSEGKRRIRFMEKGKQAACHRIGTLAATARRFNHQ
jgi:hypothetical protein